MKALLLHEEGCRPSDKQQVRPGMARHYYDLHRLIESGIADKARNDDGSPHRFIQTQSYEASAPGNAQGTKTRPHHCRLKACLKPQAQ